MRYVIYGAGAIGGVVGARLFAAGREVVLIARGAHLEAVRRDGLRLRSGAGEDTYRIAAAGNPSEIDFREGDVVILAMKTQDVPAALADLEAAAGNKLPVFCTQNGVEAERMAARRFDNIYGMMVMLLATYLEPGVVESWSEPVVGIMDAGRYPTGVDETVLAVCGDFVAAGISVRPLPDILRWKYGKFVSILSNSLEAVSGRAEAPQFLRELTEEAETVLSAAGIDFASSEEIEERRRQESGMKPRARRPGASVWQSVFRGLGSVEADYLNGEIAMLGRIHGVPAPLNETLRRLANQIARERLQPGSIPIEEVIERAEKLRAEWR